MTDFTLPPLLQQFIAEIRDLTPAERVELFWDIFRRYCPHCGREQEQGGRRCQCSNDE